MSNLRPWVALPVVSPAVLTLILFCGCDAQSRPPARTSVRVEIPPPPDVLPAAAVRLDDHEEVIGVSIEGRENHPALHRAYVVRAFAPSDDELSDRKRSDRAPPERELTDRELSPAGDLPSPLAANGPQEVVNDVLGGLPVTVVYLDSADHCQVLAPQNPPPPEWATSLGIQMMEAVDGALKLEWSGKRFQSPGPLPAGLKSQPFIRTTWGAWRAQYPNTDVYLGSLYDD